MESGTSSSPVNLASEAQIRKETSSWFHENSRPNWFHRQIISTLKCGSIPKHIAIIMDGNRRFAKEMHIERQQGHMKGFDKLSETLEWCLDLGINEVTVYAFSIENFKRSAEEVNGLMDLFRVKMQDLIDDREKLEENGVCVRVLGNISLLPEDLQKLIATAVSITSSYNRAFLNVCIAYTSRDEMAMSIREVASGIAEGKLHESDVDAELLESCFYTAPCQPVDILLRTSGEVRLSDFLLWQSSYSLLTFIRVLWPEFSRWDLYAAVLYYQQHCSELKYMAQSHEPAERAVTADTSDRRDSFLSQLSDQKTQYIAQLASPL